PLSYLGLRWGSGVYNRLFRAASDFLQGAALPFSVAGIRGDEACGPQEAGGQRTAALPLRRIREADAEGRAQGRVVRLRTPQQGVRPKIGDLDLDGVGAPADEPAHVDAVGALPRNPGLHSVHPNVRDLADLPQVQLHSPRIDLPEIDRGRVQRRA